MNLCGGFTKCPDMNFRFGNKFKSYYVIAGITIEVFCSFDAETNNQKEDGISLVAQ